jgi:hypothetical protein
MARLPFRGDGGADPSESRPCSFGLPCEGSVSSCSAACLELGEDVEGANMPPTTGMSSTDIFPSPFVSKMLNIVAVALARTVWGGASDAGKSFVATTVGALGAADEATTVVVEAIAGTSFGPVEATTVIDDLPLECVPNERLFFATAGEGEARDGCSLVATTKVVEEGAGGASMSSSTGSIASLSNLLEAVIVCG